MNASQQPKSANFNFLARRYPDLERIGALCEHYFTVDPIVALIILRQFGELLAQMVAARSGLLTDPRQQQADLLRRLRVEGNYQPSVLDLFHQIRVDGTRGRCRRFDPVTAYHDKIRQRAADSRPDPTLNCATTG